MASQLTSGTAVPPITMGVDRVRRSLKARPRPHALPTSSEPSWSPSLLADVACPETKRVTDFGYRPEEFASVGAIRDDVALAGPFKLLTASGIDALVKVSEAARGRAVVNDYVVTRRVRGADFVSTFIYNLLHDRGFLLAASRVVGVPLCPHPIRDAAAQINYYSANANEVAKWHLDGMDYVFTMVLTDHDRYEGGEYTYFQGRRDRFDRDHPEANSPLRIAPFLEAGDTLFTRGSRIYHAVTPVASGSRTTIAFSLFCPYLPGWDSNRFWHSAPDDGLLRTLENWRRLKWPVERAEETFRRVGSPIITWSDLAQ